MAIIILEGCDNTGKTQIGTELSNRIGYPYFKLKREQVWIQKENAACVQSAHAFQLQFFYEFARQIDFNVILDRFFPSEWVYGSLFRKVDEDLIWDYDRKFAALNTHIVILTKDDDKLDDELFDSSRLKLINEKYKEFVNKSACKILYLKTDDEDLEREIKEITNFLKT